MNNNLIELRFSHPLDFGTVMTAKVDPQCTAQQALHEPMTDRGGGAFLFELKPGESWELVISGTQQAIPSQTSFAQAGVVDGDLIEIHRNVLGAGPLVWDFGDMLFWSLAGASLF